jgi:hypothetical protein
VIYTPVTVSIRRRTWRRIRRGRPPCREPGPHDINVVSYEQSQQFSAVVDSPTGPAKTFVKASFNDALLISVSVSRVDSRHAEWNYCLCKHLAR